MYKVVIQAVLFSAGALFFVFNKSDGLRQASQTGDISALVSDGVASKYRDIDMTGPDPVYEEAFAQKYDPRKLWRERPKTVSLNTKTIKAAPADSDAETDALARKLAQDGITADKVSVVTLK